MKIDIVQGLNLGDEGKGLVTDYLCSKNTSLVIRYNGGHQAGHTVWTEIDGKEVSHTFSNFGSGSLRGCPTYWSKYCTVDPVGIVKEAEALEKFGVPSDKILNIDPLCPVVTPYDIAWNRKCEKEGRVGSVGVGFGATVERHEESPFKLYIIDCLNPKLASWKLHQIMGYYDTKGLDVSKVKLDEWLSDVRTMFSIADITPEGQIINAAMSAEMGLVFEGAQGIMLDRDHGYFPHVTRSYTTCRNAMEIISRIPEEHEITINLVTRAYLTRHGDGPIPTDKFPLNLIGNERETNVDNEWQGSFRAHPLDVSSFIHAAAVNQVYVGDIEHKHNFFITCLDHLEDRNKIPVVSCGEIEMMSPEDLAKLVEADQCFISTSPFSENIRLVTEVSQEEIVNI